MKEPVRRPMIDALEPRAYASMTAETVSTTYDDPTPSTVVRHYSIKEGRPIDRVAIGVDSGGVLRVNGTYGDDGLRLRPLKGGVEIRTTTRESYTYYRGSRHRLVSATSTFESVFYFKAAEFSGMVIQGGDGSDTVRAKGLTYNPQAYSIETESVTQSQPPAPDGQTPSDPVVGGKWRAGTGWATEVARQQAAANKSHAAIAVFGDSHAEYFQSVGKKAWEWRLGGKALDLGISGDGTRQMIARVERGLFDTFKPKALVVFAGTNNFNDPMTAGTDDQIYAGVMTLVGLLRQKLPDAHIILVGPLPRTNIGLTARHQLLNTRLAAAAATPDAGFEFLDVYPRFVRDKYAKDAATIGPNSHFTPRGYWLLSTALYEMINGAPYKA